MPVRRLVRVAAFFGINENQARVALSRMAARGEVVCDARGAYELAGRHLQRAARLRTARAPSPGPFDGRWHVVVVTASGEDAATRRARRRALAAARLGELREGCWMRPANVAVDLGGLDGAVACFEAIPRDPARVLAARVFDLAGWSARAAALRRSLHRALEHPPSLADGFELDAEVLRHLQRDPLLPDELLERDWPGPSLREGYERFHERYRAQLAEAHRATAGA